MRCNNLLLQTFEADLDALRVTSKSYLWTFGETWLSQDGAVPSNSAADDSPTHTFKARKWPLTKHKRKVRLAYEDQWTLPPWTFFVSLLPPSFVPEHTNLVLQWDDRPVPTPGLGAHDEDRLFQHWVVPGVTAGDRHVCDLSGELALDVAHCRLLAAGPTIASQTISETVRANLPDAANIVGQFISGLWAG